MLQLVAHGSEKLARYSITLLHAKCHTLDGSHTDFNFTFTTKVSAGPSAFARSEP